MCRRISYLLSPLAYLLTASQLLAAYWQPPSRSDVTVKEEGGTQCKIIAASRPAFYLDSHQSFPAKDGDAFEFNIRIKVGIYTLALPELVCFDAQGNEIPIPSSLESGNRFASTDWKSFRRIFPVQPGTASVRARIRATARNEIFLADWVFRPAKVDPYQTGTLITQPHAINRGGVVLEMNHGLVNTEVLSGEDRDGDGKWAVINVDLDLLTRPDKKGEDWRTGFEDNLNAILWSDGSVLKSDTVREDREPDVRKALHFKMKIHEGPYTVMISDPGRAVACSLDGKIWKRYEGGSEIKLGELEMKDGVIEFWLDACYRDRITAGPVYADYVRLLPSMNAPSVDRLFEAARKRPVKLARGSAENTTVNLNVRGPLFSGGDHWPVRCGLPIAQGELVSAENVTVLDSSGAKVPSQNRVTATWPDGSAKWIFLDFQHDFSRSAAGAYTLAYGNQIKQSSPQNGIAIQPSPDGLEVDTGAIRFLVSKQRFGILEKVQLASGQTVQKEPMALEIVETGGKVWNTLDLPVEKIEVEQSGPLHAVIRVETRLAKSGKPSEGFYHRVRIHAYAGSHLVQVDTFTANTDSRPAKVEGSMASKVMVKSLTLKVKTAAALTGAFTETGKAPAGSLVQKDQNKTLVYSGGRLKESSGELLGWVIAGLADGACFGAGVEAFREQFPKAIRWNAGGVELGLWAGEGGEYEWIEGVGKTHHLSFFYGQQKPSQAALLAQGPVLALAEGDWYARSGAFGPQVLAKHSGLPDVEKTLAMHIKSPVIDQVGLGFENYGDHSSHGYTKGTFLWDDNEYDLPAGCMVHFARTGDIGALRLGLASALHYLDVDTIHYSSKKADWAQAQHVHSHATVGGHTAQGPDFHHAGYVQGLIWYSYFTGEPIGLLGAQGIADWVTRNLDILTTGMERAVGHPLMTLNDVYEATWDQTYLRHSAQLVDQALKWEHPERSGFLAPITESPAYYSGCPFNSGLLSSALLKFNSWAGLPEVDRMLERVAQWTLTDVWRPEGLQSKGGSPRRGGQKVHISSHARLMSSEYDRTGDPFYLATPWELVVGGFGKNAQTFGTRATGLVFNYLPWLLTIFKDNGNPEPEPQLEVSLNAAEVYLARGGKAQISVTVNNRGSAEIKDFRCSFHSRVDLKTTPDLVGPVTLLPRKSITLTYEVRAPDRINLGIEQNRVAYGHWSAVYQRQGRAHLAHQSVKIVIQE